MREAAFLFSCLMLAACNSKPTSEADLQRAERYCAPHLQLKKITTAHGFHGPDEVDIECFDGATFTMLALKDAPHPTQPKERQP